MPNYPLVEARNVGEKQRPTAISLKTSFTTSEKKAALGMVNYWHRSSSQLPLAHYVVDEAELYRCVDIRRQVYEAPYRSIAVMLCTEPLDDIRMWDDTARYSVLHKTATLVAQLCLAHKIKPRLLDEAALVKWQKRRSRRRGGVISRITGEFPSERFILDVQSEMIRHGWKDITW